MKWKFYVVLSALFLLCSQVFSQSNEDAQITDTLIEVPNFEPEALYTVTGQELTELYQTAQSYQNSAMKLEKAAKRAIEIAKVSLNDSTELLNELEQETKRADKLNFQRHFFIGTTAISVGVSAITILLLCFN